MSDWLYEPDPHRMDGPDMGPVEHDLWPPPVVIEIPPPPPPAHEQVMAQALALALLATEDTENERCIKEEAVFYLPYHEALLPGHIYSESGLREFKISHVCEYHFDEWFAEVDEDPSRCPACGEFPSYCQGHGEIGDPVGHTILERHDGGDHSDCVINCEGLPE